MTRIDFQGLSRLRRLEATTLLKCGHYAGAYYLLGYAVECALKARICKKTRQHDFPDKQFSADVHTHNLEKLVGLAGLRMQLNQRMSKDGDFELNWNIVKDWNETARYEYTIRRKDARDLHEACLSKAHGILPWLVQRW